VCGPFVGIRGKKSVPNIGWEVSVKVWISKKKKFVISKKKKTSCVTL
jgi:hypothetical protein